jgi:hypothetical protein
MNILVFQFSLFFIFDLKFKFEGYVLDLIILILAYGFLGLN